MLLYILLGPLVKTTSWNEWRRCLSPFPLAEELSCAVSRRVLHVPVTALDRSSGFQHYANLWTVCGCVSVYVCMYVCMLPSEHFVDPTPQCQWHIEPPCCVYSIYLLPKKHTQSYNLSLFSSIFHSLYIPLIYSWLLLTCRLKSVACTVVR